MIIVIYDYKAASIFYPIFPYMSIHTYRSNATISLPLRVCPFVPRYLNFPKPLTEIRSPGRGQ